MNEKEGRTMVHRKRRALEFKCEQYKISSLDLARQINEYLNSDWDIDSIFSNQDDLIVIYGRVKEDSEAESQSEMVN